jgi:hypothetical protein
MKVAFAGRSFGREMKRTEFRIATAVLLCGAIQLLQPASRNVTPAKVAAASPGSRSFYVDPSKGSDRADGSLASPFQTLEKALAEVDSRVRTGIRSDKIYLRGGVYRNDTPLTKWLLNLRGTPDDLAVLSAMPAAPNTPGAVRRKTGLWYERVVFDDAQRIATPWKPVPGKPNVWQTKPGFVKLEWTHQNLWPWRGRITLTDRDATPQTTAFTVAPYMLLQDGEPLLWADSPEEIREPGIRTYDQSTDTLYVRPLGDRDPNSCRFESWYGGPEPNGDLLLLDGEGRSLFDGTMEYAAIRGFEFRMFTRLFEFHRLRYKSESDRAMQRNVLVEDNLFQYGWMHLLLDGNTVFAREDKEILPRYSDRSDWLVRHNVFYRPARECFQVHGDNHVFEHNHIVEHGGPWAGRAAVVSIVNTRNSRNIKVRHNFIDGNGNSKWHAGSVFMIEVAASHADAAGDCRYGGQTYEYNLFSNISRGTGIVLGKGNCRLTNITIRGNIFAGHNDDPAIAVGSPQANLRIEDNIFYKTKKAIATTTTPELKFDAKPSTITIRGNTFVSNGAAIDPLLPRLAEDGLIRIDANRFFNNGDPPAGSNVTEGDPGFKDPAGFDFRRKDGSAPPGGTAWWLLRQASRR